MRQEVTNFGRFYAAFNRLPAHGDADDTKRQLVAEYTGGRTESLREMSVKEYASMCAAIEAMNGSRDELRRRRSVVLKQMQGVGVDTTDWAQINDFCRHPKIAGKPFGRLTANELKELSRKLRIIAQKGWHSKEQPLPPEQTENKTYIIITAGQDGQNNN